MPSSSGIFSRFVAHEIGCYRKQPRPLVHYRLLPQRANERLLRNLFRPVAVAEPAGEVSHQLFVVGAEETLDVAQLLPARLDCFQVSIGDRSRTVAGQLDRHCFRSNSDLISESKDVSQLSYRIDQLEVRVA